MRFLGVELDAWNRFALAESRIGEGTAAKVNFGVLLSTASLFVTEHLEVVLEDIDQLIWLKSLFNSVGSAVDELIHLSVHVTGLLSNLVNEVLVIVLGAVVHWAVEVRLCLKIEHFLRCLKTNLKYFVVGFALDVTWGFLGKLQINGTFGGLLIDQRKVKGELSAGLWDL